MPNLISIIMPAFAVEKHLVHFEKAIECIIKQTYTNWELLIVCDGGFKTTIDMVLQTINKYKDKRISVYKSAKQCGSGAVRNMAIQYIKGKYVTFHDSDDYSMPDRFEKLMAQMDANGIVTSHVKVHTLYGEDGGVRDKRYSGESFNALVEKRKVKTPFCLPASIMTVDLFKAMGGFEKYMYSTEPILAIKIAYLREMLGMPKVPVVDDFLMVYNRHPHSVTTKFENAYNVKKCQSAQRKPLIRIFRERYLKGEIKKGAAKKDIMKELFIVNNINKMQLIKVK